MARTGRPKKVINQKLFENLCGIQCTEAEICGVLECSADTLNRWCKRTYKMTFADTYKSKSQVGKSSLRRAVETGRKERKHGYLAGETVP